MRQGNEFSLLPRKEPSIERIRNDPVRIRAGLPKLVLGKELLLSSGKLRRNAGQEFLDEVNKYTTHQYFAVSALGSDTAEGKLIKGVEPYRVEDPVIWFLNSNERRRWF